jgi:hypothetical protein
VDARETMRARRAALLLHGMQPTEQQKVIARLDAAESSRLIPLLAELTELGLPPARAEEVHRLVMDTAPGQTTDERGQTPLERAGRLNAEEVALALDSCAPATVARLLGAGEWAWKASVLGRMSEAPRAAVLEYLRKDLPPLAPMALQALCARLCTQAAQLPSPFEGLRAETRRIGRAAERAGVGARLRRLVGWTP